MTAYMPTSEVAKHVRRALRESFPGVKFSVRSNTYSGGASISVGWTDGPTADQVNAVTDKFAGADFDGMQDLKVYRGTEIDGQRVLCDFVICQRGYSAEWQAEILAELERVGGEPIAPQYGSQRIPVFVDRDGKAWPLTNGSEYVTDLVHRIRAATAR